MPALVGEKHLSIHFLPLIEAECFSSFDGKMYEPNPSEMSVRVFIPEPTQ